MLKHKTKSRKRSLPSRTIEKPLKLYQFPVVEGLEDISENLNLSPAEDVFGALLHAFALKPINDEKEAQRGERMLEYLERAFEANLVQVNNYIHILLMLLKEYDDKHCTRSSKDMEPHEFLKALLIEDNIPQKELVPGCFHSESQVSEFLHQKKGRRKLSFEQAVLLGERFNVDPLNFLT